jgi:hypothetical protein
MQQPFARDWVRFAISCSKVRAPKVFDKPCLDFLHHYFDSRSNDAGGASGSQVEHGEQKKVVDER